MNDLILETFSHLISETILIDGTVYAPLDLTIASFGGIMISYGLLLGGAAWLAHEAIDLAVTFICQLVCYLKERKAKSNQ